MVDSVELTAAHVDQLRSPMRRGAKLRPGIAAGVLSALLVAVPASVQPSAQAPSTGVVPSDGLTLAQVIDEALKQSPAIGAATAGLQVAAESARFARAEQLPRFDFASRYDYLGPRQQLPMRGAVFNLRQLVAPFDYNDTLYRVGAGVSLPLYSGGRISATIGREEFGQGRAQEDLRLSREELMTALARTYYRTLQLQEEVRATEASLASLRESQRLVRAQVDVGTAARVELLKINTRVAAVEQALIRVRNGEEVARTELTTLMGREGFTEKVQVRGPLAYTPGPRQLSEHLDLAIEQRPELRAQDLTVSMEQQNVRIAHAALLPQVNLNGFFEGIAGNASPFFDQESAFVAVSIPLFAAQDRVRVARARVRVNEAQEQLRQLRLRTRLEVEQAYLSLDAAEQQIAAARTGVEEAQEVLRIEQLKLSVGKGIAQDTLDAQAAALEAQNNYSRALADANVARVALARATGTVETLRTP